MQITITCIQAKQRREYKRIRAGLALFLRNLHIQNYSQHDVDLMYLGFAFGAGYAAYKRSLNTVQDGEFREEEHSRDKDGKFVKKGGNRTNTEPQALLRKDSVTDAGQIHELTRVTVTVQQGDALFLYAKADKEFSNLQRKLHTRQKLAVAEQKMADQINAAILTVSLPEQIEVYRGFTAYPGMPDWKEGVVYQDTGFCSTSTSLRVSREYATDNGYLLKIRVPAGAHALSIAQGEDIRGRRLQSKAENEVLLPSGSRFVVRKVKKTERGKPKELIVDLIVPDGDV